MLQTREPYVCGIIDRLWGEPPQAPKKTAKNNQIRISMSKKKWSKHDEELVDKAMNARSFCWLDVNENDAESPEARRLIHDIAVSLYHQEEASAYGEV